MEDCANMSNFQNILEQCQEDVNMHVPVYLLAFQV